MLIAGERAICIWCVRYAIPLCLTNISESFTIDTAIKGDQAIDIGNVMDLPCNSKRKTKISGRHSSRC